MTKTALYRTAKPPSASASTPPLPFHPLSLLLTNLTGYPQHHRHSIQLREARSSASTDVVIMLNAIAQARREMESLQMIVLSPYAVFRYCEY